MSTTFKKSEPKQHNFSSASNSLRSRPILPQPDITLHISSTMEQFTIPSVMPTSSPNHGRPVSAQDWEDQRAKIQQLYGTKGKSLDEVMDVMESVHGF
jgi:hypothetical protein